MKEALAAPEDRGGEPSHEWLVIDPTAQPEPPSYVVDGLIERGTVTLLSGDTGTGKSWLALDLAVAVLQAREWLGRGTANGSVLVIDEENPARVIRGRLRALGLTEHDAARLRYSSRQGVTVGEAPWTAWLEAQVAEHEPALVVIDTLMAATSLADVNDNSAAVAMYRPLRALAEKSGAAVVLLHHNRKRSTAPRHDSGHDAMGARQLVGQADVHITLSRPESTETARGADGRSTLATTLGLSTPKQRDGIPAEPERVSIESEKDGDGRLLSASVVSVGPVEHSRSRSEALADDIADVLSESDQTMKASEIADALEVGQDGTWNRALKAAQDDGRIEKVRRGEYRSARVAL